MCLSKLSFWRNPEYKTYSSKMRHFIYLNKWESIDESETHDTMIDPGKGKTSLALNFRYAIAQNSQVFHKFLLAFSQLHFL